MKKAIWGPCTWKVLHVLTIKIKDTVFEKEKDGLLQLIHSICANLPCPQCSSHAVGLIQKYKLKYVKTKAQLIQLIYKLHNEVNKRTKKKEYKYEDVIPTYTALNTKELLNDFYMKFISMNFGEKMMLYSFRRKLFLQNFKKYFKEHLDCFDE